MLAIRYLAVAGTLAAITIAGCQVATPTPAPGSTPTPTQASTPASRPSASATATIDTADASRDATEQARHFPLPTTEPAYDATSRALYFPRYTREAAENATSTVVAATAIAQISAARQTEAVLPTPEIIYLRGNVQKPGQVASAGVSGGAARVIAKLPTYNTAMGNHDVHPASGLVVYAAEQDGHPALWASMPGQAPRKLVEAPAGQYLESPRISPDGHTVAYASHGDGGDAFSELRLVGVDRSDDRQLAADTQSAVAPPFRLSPLGWSGDGHTLYLQSTSDSEGTPKGLHEVDAATGTLRRAQTPDEVLWHASLSPDGSHLAYASWAWAKDKDSGLILPAPPYQLRVTNLRTGETKTVLESQKQRYGAIVWSPEGRRLMVAKPDEPNDKWSFDGVDIDTGQIFAASDWVANQPPGRLMPQLWLPGERVLFTAPDGTLHLLDLDDERWQQVDKAPEVEVMGYRLPAEAADTRYDPLIQALHFGSSLESPRDEVSPDGQWVARLFVTDDPLESDAWHRSQLRVERTDGSQSWTAIDEYVAHAICGYDMETIGWTDTGDYLFGRPGCGEGCVRFGGAFDVYRLRLEDGSIASMGEGSEFALSPDGGQLASLTKMNAQGVLTIKDLASGAERSASIDNEQPTTGTGDEVGDLTWSPDGRQLALTEVFGYCPGEDASIVQVFGTETMAVVFRQRFDDPPLSIDRWLDAQHLQLKALSGPNFKPGTRVIEIPGPP